MSIVGCAHVDENIRTVLAGQFGYAGEVTEMWACGAPGLALCLVQLDDG